MTAQVFVPEPSSRVDPGGQVKLVVAVTNPSTVVDIFDVVVLGNLSPHATVTPAELHLFPDQRAEAEIVVRPPADTTLVGSIPLGLKVTSRNEPTDSIVVEATIEVSGAPKLVLTLHPHRQEGGRHSRHRAVLENSGNAPASVRLSGSDPDEELGVSIRPCEITVPAGTSATAKVRVTANHFSNGTDRPFQVMAEVVGQGVQIAEGVLAQRRQRPAWAFPVIAIAVVALIIGLLTLRRSAPHSGAGTASGLALAGSPGSATTGPATTLAAAAGGQSATTLAAGASPATTAPNGASGGQSGGGSTGPAATRPPAGPTTRSYVASTKAKTDLAAAADTATIVNTVNVPAGQWLIRAEAAAVNFGTADFVRCTLFSGGTQIDGSTAFIGSTNEYVEGIPNQALLTSGSPATVTQKCQHDHTAAVYVDPGATLVAQQVNGAQATSTGQQTALSSTAGSYTAVNGLAPGAAAQVVTSKASVVNFGNDDIFRCAIGTSAAWLDGTAATLGGVATAVETIANMAVVTGSVAQACLSDRGTGGYADPGSSLVVRPQLAGTQLARSTSSTYLATAGNAPMTVTSINVAAGSWVLSYKAAAINFGAADYVRCVISTPTGSLNATSAFLGGTHSAVGNLSGLAGLQTSSSTTITLTCQHDSQVSGIYIDPSAVLLAEPTGALS